MMSSLKGGVFVKGCITVQNYGHSETDCDKNLLSLWNMGDQNIVSVEIMSIF